MFTLINYCSSSSWCYHSVLLLTTGFTSFSSIMVFYRSGISFSVARIFRLCIFYSSYKLSLFIPNISNTYVCNILYVCDGYSFLQPSCKARCHIAPSSPVFLIPLYCNFPKVCDGSISLQPSCTFRRPLYLTMYLYFGLISRSHQGCISWLPWPLHFSSLFAFIGLTSAYPLFPNDALL